MVKHEDWQGPGMRGLKAVHVRTGGLTSEHFSVNRGVRQGLALSPTLFLLVINPLATLEFLSHAVRPWPEHIWTLSWVFRT